ncbi:hypothetical protein V9T40_014741 [Parthenolecanium corni]|uniref:Serine carboxypeptidase n=1 Tax=Parthenolecanium corni TaxID=536013 RepID=A0AAN9T405_9HEMI
MASRAQGQETLSCGCKKYGQSASNAKVSTANGHSSDHQPDQRRKTKNTNIAAPRLTPALGVTQPPPAPAPPSAASQPLIPTYAAVARKITMKLQKPAKDWKKAREEAVVKPFAGDVKSYAGFFTLNENYDSNTYFWFFLSEKKHENAPVILWLHGGPCQSSMMGLFEESGPYKIVDGGGFSYTKDRNGYSKTIDHAADNLYEAMTQFYKMFPEYEKNAFTWVIKEK